MKFKNCVVSVLSLVIFSNVIAQDSLQSIQKKIDSLEVRINEICIMNNDKTNPGITPTNDWGKGVFASTKTGTNYTFNFELGYMHMTKHKIWSKKYLGKTRNYRLGISGGIQFFNDESIWDDISIIYQSSGYGPYMKLIVGSPVLMNFISFSGHFKGMYAMPSSDSKHTITDNQTVFGFGNDIEFWLTDKNCITIGYTDEGDDPFDEDKKKSIYPSKFRFVFGTKMFF